MQSTHPTFFVTPSLRHSVTSIIKRPARRQQGLAHLQIFGGGDLQVGGVAEDHDDLAAEGLNELGVVSDGTRHFAAAGVCLGDYLAAEDLRRLGDPEVLTGHRLNYVAQPPPVVHRRGGGATFLGNPFDRMVERPPDDGGAMFGGGARASRITSGRIIGRTAS